jgi:CBS domain containing-hemolysin-like protein
MVPRKRMAALDVDTPMNDVITAVAASPYSRLPVYRGSIDNIVGVLHTKDLVRWLVRGRQADVTLATLSRPISAVHESVTADRVLRHMRERRSHQALVVDEFGGTSGVITLQNVLAEFLGEVGDEFKAADPVPEEIVGGQMRLPGSMTVGDAGAALDATLETDAATIGGYVTEALGRLPAPGDTVTVDGYSFQVERVADRAIESVIATRVSPPDDDEASA